MLLTNGARVVSDISLKLQGKGLERFWYEASLGMRLAKGLGVKRVCMWGSDRVQVWGSDRVCM